MFCQQLGDICLSIGRCLCCATCFFSKNMHPLVKAYSRKYIVQNIYVPTLQNAHFPILRPKGVPTPPIDIYIPNCWQNMSNTKIEIQLTYSPIVGSIYIIYNQIFDTGAQFAGARFAGAQYAASNFFWGPICWDLICQGPICHGTNNCGAQFAAISARGLICRGQICLELFLMWKYCENLPLAWSTSLQNWTRLKIIRTLPVLSRSRVTRSVF